ncbi:MAG TPA: sugar phosphate isomerase/epimerase family protein [Candidatus Elarobacter sp.]|jgi:sugar phosphate isomerase/epimerase|nr:sugar phosphate isomerase/epimerase family protein [Candidatus Elarobacter sp.]
MSSSNPFGISQFTTWPWSFERDLVEYPRAGAAAIEICEFKLDRNDYAPQLSAVREAGLRVSSVQTTVHAIFPDSLAPSPASPELRVRHIMASMERIAPHVPGGTPFVVITGAAPNGDCELVHATMLDVLPKLAGHAASLGMRLAFEPLNPILFHTDTALWGLGSALDLVESVGHEQLGICLDTWNIFQTPNLLDEIARARGKIFVVQVSDWRRPRANADRRNLGEGTIPTAVILAAAQRAGYDGPCVLEIFSEESLPDSLWRGDIAASLRRNAAAYDAIAAEAAATPTR